MVEPGQEVVYNKKAPFFLQLGNLLLVNSLEAATGYHGDRVPEGGEALRMGVSASTARLET